VIHKFQEWGKKAETVARNMWHNRKLMFTNHEILNLAN
jgi:hypothetical protein